MRGSHKFYLSCFIAAVGYGIYSLIVSWDNMSEKHKALILGTFAVIFLLYTFFSYLVSDADKKNNVGNYYPGRTFIEYEVSEFFSPIHLIGMLFIHINRALDRIFD